MDQIEELKQILDKPRSIVITSHRNPDGDALGSSLGLFHFLQKMQHNVSIILPSEYPEFLDWLPNAKAVIIYDAYPDTAKKKLKEADVFFSLDYNGLDRIDPMGPIVEELDCKKVMIDHHLYPEDYCDYVLSDTNASSTCELVFDFVELLGKEGLLDKTIANCLYTGILTDTGSFKYATSPKLFRIVSKLMQYGVDNTAIQNRIYNSLDKKKLELLGYCLSERMEILEEFNTGIITLSKEDYDHFDIQRGDTEGIVNYILMLKNVKFAAFITEQPKIIKLSLRSKGDFSVQAIAKKYFNGGGHRNASGGAVYGTLSSTIAKLKKILPEYTDELLKPW